MLNHWLKKLTLTSKLSAHQKIFSLAIPMILSNITSPLLGLVDTAVIGHLEHAFYLGGTTVGVMLITSIIWLCGFLRMSTTGLSAQAFGEQNPIKGIHILLRGLTVAFIISALMILMQSLYLNAGLFFAGGSDNVQFYARQYSEIRIWGLPAALGNIVILGWLLGCHKAKTVMTLMIITNVLNLLLDVVFVIGLSWQVKGIAWATLLSEYTAFILGLIFINRHYKQALMRVLYDKTTWLTAIIEPQALLKYFKLNRDIFIRTLCLELCFIFMTFQGARLGDDIVAANAILLNFLLLISFGLDGIANAAEALVGKASGEKNYQEMYAVVNLTLFWTFLFALIYTLLFYLFDHALISLISDIPSVVSTAQEYVIWLILLPLVGCWCYLFDGIYIGLMQVKAMRNSMLFSTFGCFFPLWYLLSSWGNHGLWAAFTGLMIFRGITLAWHFKTQILTARFINNK